MPALTCLSNRWAHCSACKCSHGVHANRARRKRPCDRWRGRPGQGVVTNRHAALHAGAGRWPRALRGMGPGRGLPRLLQRPQRRRKAAAGRWRTGWGRAQRRGAWRRRRRRWRASGRGRGGVAGARRGRARPGLEPYQQPDSDGGRGLQIQGGLQVTGPCGVQAS